MQISSQNKRILVFSDMHEDITRAEYILQKENYDICVSLGDEFDSHFFTTKEDAVKTCSFIKKYVFKDNFYFLFANHTIPYFWINKYTQCSGYDPNKHQLIQNFFNEDLGKIRDKFQFYLWIDEWFCSHAGLNAYHFPLYLKMEKHDINYWMHHEVKKARMSLDTGAAYWLYGAGRGRGGSLPVGGITWQDWNSEFKPILEIPMIVGHTNGKEVRQKENSYNIDTNLAYYLIIENGKVEIKKFIDL